MSREPEKLNNAQKCAECGRTVEEHFNWSAQDHHFALAESSLSRESLELYTQPTENNGTSMNGFNNLARESSLSSGVWPTNNPIAPRGSTREGGEKE